MACLERKRLYGNFDRYLVGLAYISELLFGVIILTRCTMNLQQ